MKRLLFILLMTLSTWLCAQHMASSEVPTAVVRQFHADFASVIKADWQLNKDSLYQVTFSIYRNKFPFSAMYDITGQWREKQVEVLFAELPMSVIETVVKRFDNFKPLSNIRVETLGRKPVFDVKLEQWKPGEETRCIYTMKISFEGDFLQMPELQLAGME